MENQSAQNVAPGPPQTADTQREAGSGTYTAEGGSNIINPQIIGANVRDVHLTATVLQHGQPALTETAKGPPKDKGYIQKCQSSLKSFLEKETENLCQGPEEDGSLTPLDKIYTELYITKGGSGEVNTEHEVIELECKRCPSEETKINLNDIFKPLPNEDNPPRRVLTKGIAGIGKTVSVLKFTRDWARGDTNQTFEFLFPFTFRELNLIKDERWSLMELITHYFIEVRDLEASDYNRLRVLFIFDGLDESKLDFKKNKLCRSVTEPNTVDVLLTNLIIGKLMCNASVWITSRPAASMKIPLKYIDRVTEVRGFNDKQKEEYFQRKVTDKVMAQKIFQHLQSKPLRSLFIMCHIPVFCWISATVLQNLLTESHEGELPKTVTEMYTHFLIVLMKMTQEKDYQDRETDRELIMKLGKLAFEQLKKGNMIFDEDALRDWEIDLTQAAIHSGVCTQIIKKERGLHKHEMYCFIHLSVQEFLAALYVLETFIDSGVNLLGRQTGMKMTGELPIIFLHRNAVDMALASDYGQWDLFLRFLLGLSQDENQRLIQKVFGFKAGRLLSNKVTISYIHQKIKKQTHTEHRINLFQCLNELGDHSLVDQVLKYQSSRYIGEISPAHWSALAYNLLISNEDLDLFDLRKFCKSEDALERLLPVVKVSKTALLTDCRLTDRGCRYMSSVLSFKSSGLETLDLSRNDLQDSGMRLLSDGLKSPNCKLQRLILNGCNITMEGCHSLANALTSDPSHLRELDLSENKFQDEGLQSLLGILDRCSLETLRLAGCGFSEVGCAALASSLRSNPTHLKVLDLGENELKDNGVHSLSEFLTDSRCGLESLILKVCMLTELSCSYLGQICCPVLKELDLSSNQLGEAGVKHLCEWLGKPQCCLEILRLAGCGFSEVGCAALASSLRSNPTHLKVLDLERNELKDNGVHSLSGFLTDSLCGLERLSLKVCMLTELSCSYLGQICCPVLKDLDLSFNELGEAGVKHLCEWLGKPQCCLEILRLAGCEFSEVGCAALASSLRSNPTHLKVLDLDWNELRDNGVHSLSGFLTDSLCGLERLSLELCMLTELSCSYLGQICCPALKDLDLTWNQLGEAGVEHLCEWLGCLDCQIEAVRIWP
ncbi:NACHT, LRR and PYD domains-containing protein 12-like isoform X2 [Cheilinus undulatus]|uniref:NACHT, LRR and PYD domains-containing protein 12-like isoform X2 n=1 Tax=Cheilinus undulatus TaxID=241271 RepID=UPI001BD380B2|nr:NACHT, LRR and PYD domains-containing protein 12-like isoform X2 [Cheilinus undulatus]